MSERMNKLLPKVFPKVSFGDFKNIVDDIVNKWKVGEIDMDISVSRVLFRSSREIREQLSKKHKVKFAFMDDLVSLMILGFRTILAGADEVYLKRLKRDKRNLAREFFLITNDILESHPEIKNRFLTMSFCKTRFLEQLDWEINLKTWQPEETGFEKGDRYPVCLLRFTLGFPEAFRKTSPEQPEEFSFEAGSHDISRIIRTLTGIREKMLELDQKLAKGEI